MGLDVDKLLSGLSNYKDSLSRHLFKLQEDFDLLTNTYMRLNQEYDGQGAEEFKSSWNKTARWFETYIDNNTTLCNALEDRIESLKKVAYPPYAPQHRSNNSNLGNHVKDLYTYLQFPSEHPYYIKSTKIESIKTKNWNKKLEKKGKPETFMLELPPTGKLEEMLGVQNKCSNNCPNQTPNYYKINDFSRLEINNPYRGYINYPYYTYYKRRTGPYSSYISKEIIEEIINRVIKELNKSNINDYYKINYTIHDVLNKYHHVDYVSPSDITSMIREIELRYYRNPTNSINYRHPFLRFDQSWSGLPLE